MLYSLLTCVGEMLRLLKSAGINGARPPLTTPINTSKQPIKSAGINGVVLLDVNACGDNVNSLRLDTLKNISTYFKQIHKERCVCVCVCVCVLYMLVYICTGFL